MNGTLKGMLLVLLIIYIISPLDLFPGPVDDIIIALCAIGGSSITSGSSD